jgi:hypothetical protein
MSEENLNVCWDGCWGGYVGGLGGWGKALKRFFTMREKKENIGVQMCCIVEDAV